MKKIYVTQCILIGLLAISLPLSGMIKNDIQLTKINFEAPLAQKKQLEPWVFIISDNNKRHFVLKFQPDPTSGILDVLGTEVGKNRVDINQVQIFPPYYFKDKFSISIPKLTELYEYTSTLHTYIENDSINLHTYISTNNIKTSPIYKAINNSAQLSMAYIYKNLAPMIALNIYVNNVDCRESNILFNSKESKYYLIDMDCCFMHIFYPEAGNDYQSVEYDLAQYTSNSLKRMQLDSMDIEALTCVNTTLGELIQQYPPQSLLELFTKIAQEADESYDDKKQQEFLSGFETYYEKNKLLHSQINTLIGYKGNV